jgi:aspartyl-tRNA(Asn)/glutamyl-tRNA(Gln) amidotransferase subunit C
MEMKITAEEVKHVADLARLKIDPGSVETISRQVATILTYVDTLNEVNTDNVPPTAHAITLTNTFREDVEQAQLPPEQALANAPSSEGGCFVVPKVI